MFSSIFTWLKEYGVLLLGLIKKYGIKTVLTVLLIGMTIFGIGYFIDYKIKEVVPETVENAIDKSIKEQDEEHQEKLVKSQEVYTEVKKKLRSTMRETGCEYIYLIEYHNGSTNIATSFPFRKFDVTIDMCKEGEPYIDSSPLKDEHITKYDIFDNPEFTQQQFAYCSREEFEKVDVKLFHMMSHNESVKWIYTFNLYYEGKLLGAVMVLSYKELDVKKFINCMHELENIFNTQE